MVRTLSFHCRGHRFDPGLGTKILRAAPHCQKKKKGKRPEFPAVSSLLFSLCPTLRERNEIKHVCGTLTPSSPSFPGVCTLR